LLKEIENPADSAAWLETIGSWKKKHPLVYSNTGRIKPQYVVEQIDEATKGEAIIATEVGQNQMWAAQWYKYTKPRTFVSSGGLGTMGFGFPAAMGAKMYAKTAYRSVYTGYTNPSYLSKPPYGGSRPPIDYANIQPKISPKG